MAVHCESIKILCISPCKVQDRKNAGGRLATKVNNAWTTALASQVVELGGVPITKEEIKKQVLADDDEEEEKEEAGPSNKKLKKGGQQKIDFPRLPKQQQPTLQALASWGSSLACSSWGSRA